MNEEALRHLRRDKKFAALIRRVGPPQLGIQRGRSPYEALMRAIAHQQLHGRAALAILARFEALYPADGFPAARPRAGESRDRAARVRLFRLEDSRDAGDLRGGTGRHGADAARLRRGCRTRH